MKLTHFKTCHVVALGTLLSTLSPAWAFEDLNEPDDTFQQAHDLFVNDSARRQYTLHSRTDQDWFRFHATAKTTVAGKEKNVSYDLKVAHVGSDINPGLEIYDADGTTLLAEKKGCCLGDEKAISPWQAPKDGYYYLKVSDIAPASSKCRINIQYELQITYGLDVSPAVIEGNVLTVTAKTPIAGAKVRLCDEEKESDAQGKYYLQSTCSSSTLELTVMAAGYRTLTCHLLILENSKVTQNFSLLSESEEVVKEAVTYRHGEDKLVPSQAVYHNGDTLQVVFPFFNLPPDICVRYYLGIGYPDGNLMVIKERNQLQSITQTPLPPWNGRGYMGKIQDNVGQFIMEMPVDDQLPRGQYKLYLLRMPAMVENPMNNLGLGELNVSNFEVK
jgi:hypothetical protein